MQTHEFYKTLEETQDWLDSMRITDYTIDPDTLVVDVNSSVSIMGQNIKYIPVKFRKVSGMFIMIGCNLKSMVGSPDEVGGVFAMSKNYLRSLEGGPNIVGDDYRVSYNKISSLKGSPEEVKGVFLISNNRYLESYLEGPQNIKGLDISKTSLKSLEGIPDMEYGSVDASYCKLINIDNTPKLRKLNINGNLIIDIREAQEKVSNLTANVGNIILFFNESGYGSNVTPFIKKGLSTEELEEKAKKFLEIISKPDVIKDVDTILDKVSKTEDTEFVKILNAYSPRKYIDRVTRAREVTGGLFEL